MKKVLIILGVLLVCAGGAAVYWFVFHKDLSGQIIIPYIAHQKPRIDPHVPSPIPIADKLDEVVFDGLFNVSANPSGITYEDGLGEYLGIDPVSLPVYSNRRIKTGLYLSMMNVKKLHNAQCPASRPLPPGFNNFPILD